MVAIPIRINLLGGERKTVKKGKGEFKKAYNPFKIKPIGKTSKTRPGKKPVK